MYDRQDKIGGALMVGKGRFLKADEASAVRGAVVTYGVTGLER
jgi:hypothetical protein